MTGTLALFQNTRAAIKAEQLCKAHQLHCKVVPVPREISSECGMALQIRTEDASHAEALFLQHQITFSFFRSTNS